MLNKYANLLDFLQIWFPRFRSYASQPATTLTLLHLEQSWNLLTELGIKKQGITQLLIIIGFGGECLPRPAFPFTCQYLA